VDVAADSRVQVWLEAATRLVSHFGKEVCIRGNCDQAPFSLASMMRGAADWMIELTDPENHDHATKLLDHCAEAHLQLLRLMADTGVHMVSCGDSPAGPSLVSPRMYRTFALPWEKRLADEAQSLGLPFVLHICGRTELILDDMLSTGANGLELDHQTDAGVAHGKMKERAVFVGNLDPSSVVCLGSPELVEAKTRELLEIFADTPRFVLNAGCAIPASTPSENIRAMIRVARES
jgi:MtaA/CmuA family methyltransferase